MGRYIAPSDPYQPFGTGCLKVYFPDDPLFFRALMGQIAELESRFIWDTDGDVPAADHIEQLWLVKGEQTRAEQEDPCADCSDVQQQLDECQQQLEEINNMEITVNCNCGTCAPIQPLPELVDPTGQTIDVTCVYVDPENPNDEGVPSWDDQTQTPPAGYPDWQTFVDNRCLMANYMVDAFLETAEKLDDAENRSSVILDIVSLALLFIPIPVGKTKGALTVLKWVSKLAAFLQLVEEPLDYLQWFQDIVADDKQTMVCFIYQAQDPQTMVDNFTTFMQDSLDLIPGYTSLAQDAQNAFSDYMVSLAEDILPLAQNFAASTFVPDDYVAEIDCTQCDNPAPEGFEYVKMDVEAVLSHSVGGGASGFSGTVQGDGSLLMSFTGTGSGSLVDCTFSAVKPPVRTDAKYLGFVLDFTSPTNVQDNMIRVRLPASPVNGSMWDGDLLTQPIARHHMLRDDGAASPPQYPTPAAPEFKFVGVSVNVQACDTNSRDIRIGYWSAASGVAEITVSGFWVVKLNAAC